MSLKQKIIALVIVIGIALIALFQRGIYPKNVGQPATVTEQTTPSQPVTSSDEVKVLSTKPSLINNTIITPIQAIEITFNRSLENAPEVRSQITPNVDYKVKLSNDSKTVIIMPTKAYDFNQGYSLVIKSETKFIGGKTLGHDENFYFKTISYQGI